MTYRTLRHAFFLLALGALALPAAARVRIRFDGGWRFMREKLFTLTQSRPVVQWQMHIVPSDAPRAAYYASPNTADTGEGWQTSRSGDGPLAENQWAWFRAVLPSLHVPERYAPAVQFTDVDDNGTVYLNGKKLYHHEGWGQPFTVSLQSAWNPHGPNVLAVLVQNVGGPGGISGPVEAGLTRQSAAIAPWRPGFSDKGWQTVQLPHDYVIQGKFTSTADAGHGSLPTPQAWYRKTFFLPQSAAGKTLYLYFEGVFSHARVWVNGHYMGLHHSGYTSFRYNITRWVHPQSRNVVAVHVNPSQFEGWWYEGGGIYRHVYLEEASQVHFKPWSTFVYTELPAHSYAHALAPVRTMLSNAGSTPAVCTVEFTARDPKGNIAAEKTLHAVLPPYSHRRLAVNLSLNHPQLWDLQHPRLYALQTRVLVHGSTADSNTTDFGVRRLGFTPDQGFFLNGKHVEIQGFCNHQDFIGVGIGIPDYGWKWRLQRLKSIGCNALRCSHNPPAPAMLNYCDRMGILVMDETRHLGDGYGAKASPQDGYSNLTQLKSMVRRDRNHPCVFLWSLCNEEPLQGTPIGEKMAMAMKKVVERLDGTRAVTAAMNGGFGHGISHVVDIQGFNYNTQEYDPYHAAHPGTPLFGSETASDLNDRGVYTTNAAKGFYTDHGNTTVNAWYPIAIRPFMCGGFVWTGFDYKGEPTPYGWPCVNSKFGALDMCGFRKDEAWYYEAWWAHKKVVHIFPQWNRPGQEGKVIHVRCFSSCNRVDLMLNGKDLGEKTMPRYRYLEWNVPYAPGTLKAVGYSADGKKEAVDVLHTTGAPYALRLSTWKRHIKDDNEDISMVKVEVVDRQGRVVTNANSLVHFAVTGVGSIAGAGNGDPADHTPDQAHYRKAFYGLCMALVRGGRKPGRLVLTARAAGLKSASISFVVSAR